MYILYVLVCTCSSVWVFVLILYTAKYSQWIILKYLKNLVAIVLSGTSRSLCRSKNSCLWRGWGRRLLDLRTQVADSLVAAEGQRVMCLRPNSISNATEKHWRGQQQYVDIQYQASSRLVAFVYKWVTLPKAVVSSDPFIEWRASCHEPSFR